MPDDFFTVPAKGHRAFKRGETVISGGFPAVVAGRSTKLTTVVEVFGFGHDTGSTYTKDISECSLEIFEEQCKIFGYDPRNSMRDGKSRKILGYD